MKDYKYILEPYNGMSSRHRCPKCKNRTKTFTRYINTENGQYIDVSVGICNRYNKCGYHYSPKQYFLDNSKEYATKTEISNLGSKSHSNLNDVLIAIPKELLIKSLNRYEENNFIQYLIKSVGQEKATESIRKYYVGTSKLWKGASVFWQVDKRGGVRTGKIMLYDSETGRRVKEPYSKINWVHSVLKMVGRVNQCFFGEHLLNDTSKPIGIVESEKTAIVCSVYFPEFTWIATGGLSNLNPERCTVLIGRRVVLFPDLNCYDKWKDKVDELKGMLDVEISNFLELKATDSEKKQGFDLADYLVTINYTDINKYKANLSEEEKLERMIKKNTALKKLIDTLNLQLFKILVVSLCSILSSQY